MNCVPTEGFRLPARKPRLPKPRTAGRRFGGGTGAPASGISQSSTCICLPAEASAQAGAFLSSLKKSLFQQPLIDAESKVNPVRNSSETLNPAGIILKSNPAAEQQGIISNGVNTLETGMTFPRRFPECGFGYSFPFFCKNAVSKSIGRGRITVEFFLAAKTNICRFPALPWLLDIHQTEWSYPKTACLPAVDRRFEKGALYSPM